MKKRNTMQESLKQYKSRQGPITIGIDLGDKTSHYCLLDDDGEVVAEGKVATTRPGMEHLFGKLPRCRMVLEVGTHSPWVSRLLSRAGHEVIVANARQVQLISQSSRKDDRLDAETLARLGRVDPKLLRPIQHRGEATQLDLQQVRVRAALVEARISLVNAARGLAKAAGERIPSCDTDHLDTSRLALLPGPLQEVLRPLVEQVVSLTESIQRCDQRLEQLAETSYPETQRLKQVNGVGTLISLGFVLTIDDPSRFQRSRDVGCFVGLRPKRSDSGESQPQLRITKEGDVYLRKLLVQGAHCILKPRSPDSDLKRWGQKLAGRGGKNARKRAVVAVARKLAILLHRLWVTGEVYEPLRNSQAAAPPSVATQSAGQKPAAA